MNSVLIEPSIDQATLRHAFSTFPSGVTVLAAIADGQPAGIVASSFTSVSLDPPLVSVCIGKTSRTWSHLRKVPQIGVSVFAEHQETHCQNIVRHHEDAFVQSRWRFNDGGALTLRGCCATFRCVIEAEHEAGDHTIVVLRIQHLEADHSLAPMVFYRSQFSRVAKPGINRALRPHWLAWDESASCVAVEDVWG
ncbi:flavin reductase (DIM6/NTAB) family NADH-FMN oxidoreductase RutF [Mycobacterium sp. MAA66]|uniref:flavin reductase family protein n=1 Tax=Mycobacterium sp. MAA66 TaxID=3156297 RepID=UPI003510F5E6